MTKTSIADIKQILLSTAQPMDVTDCFLDWSVAGGGHRMGARVERPPFLAAVLERVAAEILREPVTLENDLWLRVVRHRFVHGFFTLGSRFGQALLFEDVAVGALSLCELGSDWSHHARFTVLPAPPANPGAN